MLEQSTIKQGMELASQFGWVGTAVVLYLLGQTCYTIYSNFTVKRKAFDPLARLVQDLEKRATYEWTEKQLEKYQLKEVAKVYADAIDKRLSHIEDLLQNIDRKLSERFKS